MIGIFNLSQTPQLLYSLVVSILYVFLYSASRGFLNVIDVVVTHGIYQLSSWYFKIFITISQFRCQISIMVYYIIQQKIMY